MLCRAYRLMGPAPEIMAGTLHLQHVFATPQDLDRRSSLLLGVQPSKIQVNLRERERERVWKLAHTFLHLS